MDRLEFKATLTADAEGHVEGLAWPFASPDRINDRILPGAFASVVAPVPMLFAHDFRRVIGGWTGLAETPAGLEIKGLIDPASPDGRTVLAGIRRNLLTGLSIGFRVRRATGVKGLNRVIEALDLAEVSIVRNPAHPGARLNRRASIASPAIRLVAALQRASTALQPGK